MSNGCPLCRIQATAASCRCCCARASSRLCIAAPQIALLSRVGGLACCPTRPLAALLLLLLLLLLLCHGRRRRGHRRVAVVGCPVRLQWLLLLLVGWRLALHLQVGRRSTVVHSRLLCLVVDMRLLHVRPAILRALVARTLLLPLARLWRPLLLVRMGRPAAILLVWRRGAILLHTRPLLIALLLLLWQLQAGRWCPKLLRRRRRQLLAGRWCARLRLLQRRWLSAVRHRLCLPALRCSSRCGCGCPLIELRVADARRLWLQHLQAQQDDHPAAEGKNRPSQ